MIKGIDEYKYLGVIFTATPLSETEIKRIGQGRTIIKQLNTWSHQQTRPDIKKRVYITIVESFTTYGECWR